MTTPEDTVAVVLKDEVRQMTLGQATYEYMRLMQINQRNEDEEKLFVALGITISTKDLNDR